jgi:hypothetical protein
MPKFMSSHTLAAGALKLEQFHQMARAAQSDAVVKPHRSFLNLAEGKVFCVMEAPNKEALAAWFREIQLRCDYITPVELEGEPGHFFAAAAEAMRRILIDQADHKGAARQQMQAGAA